MENFNNEISKNSNSLEKSFEKDNPFEDKDFGLVDTEALQEELEDEDFLEDDEGNEIIEKKGGSYKDVKKNSDGNKDEVHHMPADSSSNIERGDGPAIKMEKEDHRKTASCGNSKEAREYRAEQEKLINEGKFREALQMDIDDIKDKFGDKYNDAIDEMLDYVNELEKDGKING